MKAGSVASCIMLSTLVLFVLSMAAQATEYREVKAEEILKQIENGEDVNYKDCRIIGELDASKLKLETVPNPFFYERVNNGYKKEDLINYGLSENLSFIKSNITITDSIFDNCFNFQNVLFNSSADFTLVTFNSSANFSQAIFNSSANFRGATFNSFADFSQVKFKSNADFSQAKFNNSANFMNAKFSSFAVFGYTKFNSSAKFLYATFNSTTYFAKATFNSSADFSGAKFNNSTDFYRATINGYAIFMYATFNNSAEFMSVKFNSSADFTGATFNGFADLSAIYSSSAKFSSATFNSPAYFDGKFNNSADFTGATFNSSTDFARATFNSSADFTGTTFNSPAYFNETTFDSSADFSVPETSENIFTGGKTCEFFRKSYNSLARYEDADNIYYNFRKLSMEQESISISKVIDSLSWVTCGFGTKLEYTFLWIIGIILFFAFVFNRQHTTVMVVGVKNKIEPLIVYYKEAGIYRSSEEDKTEKSKVSFWECLCFSVNTFTRLGTPNWHQRDKFWYAVTIEGVLGWVMLAIFLATLMHLLMRP